MKGSIIILAFFVSGLLLGRFELLPETLVKNDFTLYVLYLLMFFVGINIGCDESIVSAIRSQGKKILVLPFATIIGTLLGAALVGLFYKGLSLTDSLAVASGFGYYSLSSVFITQYKGAELGTVALVSNVTREIITLVFAPLIALYFGKLAPISAGGATTMDTTLPIITKVSGREFVVIAIVHGVIVDLSVPFLVTLFCSF